MRSISSTPPAPRSPPTTSSPLGPTAVASHPSIAQPFSTPFTPPPTPLTPAQIAEKEIYANVKSSVPAGVRLTGLGYLKGKEPPTTKEVDEYPVWLWGLLDKKKKREGSGEIGKDGEEEEGDAYSKSKKQRRLAARAAKKLAEQNKNAAPVVPIDQQSIDLPGGDGTLRGAVEAERAREELTDAMRKRRKKGIKEANFLKGI
ncbi:MAG: hypothetical protein MMC33_002325 [Icmadophila ericetorum]|nr:hypothetical protein [Icmadophila ericetorum]